MCGRFAQKTKPNDLAKQFQLFRITEVVKSWKPRYNLSPTQNALVIRAIPESEPAHEAKRELTLMRWGLIPNWSKEIGKYSTFNARAETLDTKPTFRSAFRHNRAIVPVDGYYEWENLRSAKRPLFFTDRIMNPWHWRDYGIPGRIQLDKKLRASLLWSALLRLIFQPFTTECLLSYPKDTGTNG